MGLDCGSRVGEGASEAPALAADGVQTDLRERGSGPEAASWVHGRVRPCFRAAPWTLAARLSGGGVPCPARQAWGTAAGAWR